VRLALFKNDIIMHERRIFARNFKEAREKAGLTQMQIMEITGLTQALISRIENGRGDVKIDTARRLAEAVNQPLCKLVNPVEK
jgi:transcriptional regulator with XRE-family HTH domain